MASTMSPSSRTLEHKSVLCEVPDGISEKSLTLQSDSCQGHPVTKKSVIEITLSYDDDQDTVSLKKFRLVLFFSIVVTV